MPDFDRNIKQIVMEELKQKPEQKIETLNQKTALGNSPLRWSARLRSTDISITNSIATRTNIGSNSSSGGILLAVGNQDSFKWAVKIHKLVDQIHIGICLVRHVKRKRFCFPGFSSRDHGHWGIDWSGWIFSHSDSKINFKNKGTKFTTGDVLIFQKNEDNLEVTGPGWTQQFSLQKLPPGQYAPFVYLYKLGDSVQIL